MLENGANPNITEYINLVSYKQHIEYSPIFVTNNSGYSNVHYTNFHPILYCIKNKNLLETIFSYSKKLITPLTKAYAFTIAILEREFDIAKYIFNIERNQNILDFMLPNEGIIVKEFLETNNDIVKNPIEEILAELTYDQAPYLEGAELINSHVNPNYNTQELPPYEMNQGFLLGNNHFDNSLTLDNI